MYDASFESLSQHPLPRWFDDAKLGIFIHWGPYSVPAWAPKRSVDFTAPDWLAQNPYAEWYLNTLSIEGSATAVHHREAYGEAYAYERFGETLRDGVRAWEPEPWAQLFADAGARYVIPGTKHHDGFLMWPSRNPNPHRANWQMERDVIGELAAAVRARGMRYGLYYSGGLDWTFRGLPIDSIKAMIAAIPQDEGYARYADAHWRELIERYEPSVLWNDIAYPLQADYPRLFADYYNTVADSIVNDRFDTIAARSGKAAHDFQTPEYSTTAPPGARKWECCRGIGNSFGFNRAEDESDYISADALVHLLIGVVANNGNLLLNVGPTASGEIPWPQAQRLLALGAWLRTNGEAIYGTRPWRTPEATTVEGHRACFTATDDALYAIVLEPGDSPAVTLAGLDPAHGERVTLLGRSGEPLSWTATAAGLRVTVPPGPQTSPAIALKVEPKPP